MRGSRLAARRWTGRYGSSVKVSRRGATAVPAAWPRAGTSPEEKRFRGQCKLGAVAQAYDRYRPDERLAAVLARRLPTVRLLVGRAESLPLSDASVDAVLVSSAWHWLDVEAAVAEIARVLHPGGLLGTLWTSLDRQTARGAVLWESARGLMPHRSDRSQGYRPEAVCLPAGGPFAQPEIASLQSSGRVRPGRLAEVIGTYSSVITLPAPERERLLAQVRDSVAANPAFVGRARVTVPFSCRCCGDTGRAGAHRAAGRAR